MQSTKAPRQWTIFPRWKKSTTTIRWSLSSTMIYPVHLYFCSKDTGPGILIKKLIFKYRSHEERDGMLSRVTTYCLIANPPTGRTTPQKRLFSAGEMTYFGLQTTETEPLWSFSACRPRLILLITKSSSIVSTGTVASLVKRSAGLIPIYAAELRWSRSARPHPKKSIFVSEFQRLSPWQDSFYHLYLSTSISDSNGRCHHRWFLGRRSGSNQVTPHLRSLSLTPAHHLSLSCLLSLSAWCLKWERFYLENRVKLNIDKTVYFLAAPKNKLDLFPGYSPNSRSLGNLSRIQCRNLGVLFDSGLTMEHQVKSVAKAAFFHLRLIARIRRFFDQSAAKALVHAFVMSRLDYCNSLFAGLPEKTTTCLQRVQNAATQLILRRGRRESASPLLKELKWLPVKHRIIFKATTFASCCRLSPLLVPVYLSSLFSAYNPTRSLRSTSTTSLSIPRARLVSYGARSFSFLGFELFSILSHPPSLTRPASAPSKQNSRPTSFVTRFPNDIFVCFNWRLYFQRHL